VEDFVTQAVEQYGYAAIFLLMLLGSACIPIPSEVVLLFGGAFATAAVGGDAHLNFWMVCLVATAGNLAGSLLAYWIGRVGGRPLAERWGTRVLLQPHDIDRAEVWFERHGEVAVFFSRMIPVVRAFISLPAGVAEMPLGKFTLYTFLGSLPWTFGLAAAGYALGSQWTKVRNYLLPVTIAVALLTLGVIGWWVAGRIRRRRAGQPAGEG
jgi:membrane protein DedA with SNARE-associated domain